MSQEILNIVLSVVSLVITGLATWGVTAFTNWLNSKIKDKQLASYLTDVTRIVTDAVMSVYQSYVETLKESGTFGEEEQQVAKNKALEIINTQLTAELRNYINTNYGDIEKWLSNKIETVIYTLKVSSKIKTEGVCN